MIDRVLKTLKVSERRACRVIGQVRTSQRYIPKVRSEEERLTVEIVNLATRYGRYGYRRITALLKQQGWKVNHKTIEENLEERRTEGTQETTKERTALA